jgi:hypothetical protein
MTHFVVKCKGCGTVMEQCRCFSLDKTVTYKLCDICKSRLNEIPSCLAPVCESSEIDWESEIRAVIATLPKSCQIMVREGNGPENLAASLAVSVGAVVSALEKYKTYDDWV